MPAQLWGSGADSDRTQETVTVRILGRRALRGGDVAEDAEVGVGGTARRSSTCSCTWGDMLAPLLGHRNVPSGLQILKPLRTTSFFFFSFFVSSQTCLNSPCTHTRVIQLGFVSSPYIYKCTKQKKRRKNTYHLFSFSDSIFYHMFFLCCYLQYV